MSGTPLTPEEIEAIERIEWAGKHATHYDVLEVDLSAPREEIDRAYKDLVRRWHPDRFFRRDTGHLKALIDENFDTLTQAHSVLSNEGRRDSYDRDLKSQGRQPAPRQPKSTVEPAKPAAAHAVEFDRKDGKARIAPLQSSKAPESAVSRVRPSVAPAAVNQVKRRIAENLAKAREYARAGKAKVDEGDWGKAESLYYLATRFDPTSAEYRSALEEAQKVSRARRVVGLITQGDSAASYGRYKEAIAHYRKACEGEGPPDGGAYFKLGQLLLSSEDDARGAVEAWRRAVQKEPKNITYRWALAELYEKSGLKANALREAHEVLKLDPKHAGALKMAKRLKA